MGVCTQRNIKSVSASTQSDQSLKISPEEALDTWLPKADEQYDLSIQ